MPKKELETTHLSGKLKKGYGPTEKDRRKQKVKNEIAAREKAGVNAPKRDRPAGPLKKTVSKVKAKVKEAKKVLPETRVIEDRNELSHRMSTRGDSNPRVSQSRTEFVAKARAAGKTVKPRSLEKKGWGKNAPVKKRMID